MRSLMTGILQQERNFKKKQYALSFDGVDDYVLFPAVVNFKRVDIELSLQHIATTSYFLGGPLGNDVNGARYNGETLLWYTNAPSSFQMFNYVPNSLFSNLSFRYEAGWWNVYENDIMIREKLISAESIINATLGRRGGGAFNYNGLVTKLKYYDSAGLVRDYDFSTGQGSTLFDKSQNQNHGTIYGAQWVEI